MEDLQHGLLKTAGVIRKLLPQNARLVLPVAPDKIRLGANGCRELLRQLGAAASPACPQEGQQGEKRGNAGKDRGDCGKIGHGHVIGAFES